MQRYIAFDVETPNRSNSRMSAIGITVIEENQIKENLYSLVNPEVHFDSFNIELTGITPDSVSDAPNFSELWQTIEPIMNNGILIAHNAPFDMGVLAKCLGYYGIDWKKQVQYACTCNIGRKCLPYVPNHRLNTLCDYLNIQLDHHNAGSDSLACAELLLHYIGQGVNINGFVRNYDLLNTRTLNTKCI